MKLPRFLRKIIHGEADGVTVGDVVKDAWVARNAGDAAHGEVIAIAYDCRPARPVLRPVVQWRRDGFVDHHKGSLVRVQRGEKSIEQVRADLGLPPLPA